MNILRRAINTISQRNKKETLEYLQAMPTEQLVEGGFSPALIEAGIGAWPWREDQQVNKLSIIESMIAEEQRCVNELERCSDAELADLGLSRGTIRHSVRHGRPGIDKNTHRQAA